MYHVSGVTPGGMLCSERLTHWEHAAVVALTMEATGWTAVLIHEVGRGAVPAYTWQLPAPAMTAFRAGLGV